MCFAPPITKCLHLLRRLPAVWRGQDAFIRPTAGCFGHVERFGSRYGGWSIITDGLRRDSVIYSFGVGEDVSFDLALVARTGLCVHAFDPTPKSIAWVRAQNLTAQFVLHEFGLAAVDGDVVFNPPQNPAHVSCTMLDRPSTSASAIHVPVQRLSTIMNSLGHKRIDILKMDIEGAEYAVIDDLDQGNIRPGQILVEFHHRFPGVGIARTKASIVQITQMGYDLFAVSSSGEEFAFVHRSQP